MNKKAPVLAASHIDVSADVSLVWDVAAGIEQWPEWNADVKWTRVAGQVEPGVDFTWRVKGVTVRSQLLEVDRSRSMAWSGRLLGIRAVHTWQFEAMEGGTRVSTEESWDSLLVSLLRWPLRRLLKSSLDASLRSLKAEAERRAGG